jgi:NaMN:DMB phosphoribosyltransferase
MIAGDVLLEGGVLMAAAAVVAEPDDEAAIDVRLMSTQVVVAVSSTGDRCLLTWWDWCSSVDL